MFVTFFQNGRQLYTSKNNCRRFVSIGEPTGVVGTCNCFASITLQGPAGKVWTVTSKDFDGPVCFRIVGKGDEGSQWLGLASRDEVKAANAKQAAK